YHLALVKGQSGSLIGALNDLNRVINEKEDFGRAYYNRGIIKQRLQRFEEAIKDYSKAIKLEVKIADIYARRAEMYLELGEKKKACTDLKNAVKLDDGYKDSYNNYCL
ncbi:MAG: tetratricopeptide repeat protein, partial [Cyclobacteriaceae bacterium]|nr:tetratricopeptide repeat protein [Cyclobacteriaceae bacterium]